MEPGDDRGVRDPRFRQALAALHELLAARDVPAPILRDALIQRFEFTFEAMWKALQARARDQGLEAGSPRQSAPILSISSSRKNAFVVLAFFIDWMILPGMEPI